jgi:serine/threonine protein kinase
MSDVFRKGDQVGPYRIVRPVPGGVGGMATVYQARLGKQLVALKVAHQGLSGFVKDESAFLRARELDHPHIIKILPTPLADGSREYTVKDPQTGRWYFAMEYMAGGDLDQWMQRQERIPLRQALRIVQQAGSALDAAHSAKVLHLDVKPSNILFRADPRKNGLHAVLTDFGIARPEGRLASGQTLTVEYASPEQARRAQGELIEVGKASDLYSLAVIFYEMVTGHLPFDAQNDTALLHHIVYEAPDTVINDLPKALVPAMTQALAKGPEQRYPSATAFVADLEQLSMDEDADTQVAARSHRAASGISPLAALGLGILIGVGLGGPAGYYFGNRGGDISNATPVVVTTVAPTEVPMAVEETLTATPTPTEASIGDVMPIWTPTPITDTPDEAVTPTSRVLDPTSTPQPPTLTPTPRPPTLTPIPTTIQDGGGGESLPEPDR